MAKTKQTAKKSTGGTAASKKTIDCKKTDPKTSKTPQSDGPSQFPMLNPNVEMAKSSTPGLDAPVQVVSEEGRASGDEDGDDVSYLCSG